MTTTPTAANLRPAVVTMTDPDGPETPAYVARALPESWCPECLRDMKRPYRHCTKCGWTA